MKLNPMSPKIAATILLLTAGATLGASPATASEEKIPAPIAQTIEKYEVSSFKTPAFESPKVVSWAVAYHPEAVQTAEVDPAKKALLTEDAQIAQKQKTVTEKEAAVKRIEQERIAAEKAAAEKAEADRLAAEKAAKDIAEAEAARISAEAERAAAEKAAAEKAVADKLAVETAAADKALATYANTVAQRNGTAVAANSYTASPATSTSTPSAPTASTPAPASSGIAATLVASAYSQLGIHQDCTAMVEKALRSAGKSVGDLAPTQFYAYGTVVTNPQPGDLMIQPGHVAIYVGNGMAISGGFNGYDTVLHPAKYLTGAVYVRVS